MFKKLCLLTTSLVLAGGTVWAEEPVPYNCDFSPSCEVAPGIYGAMGSPVMSKFKLSIGGYVKLDYAHNTNAVGPRSSPAGAPLGGSKDESMLTAKQSRFWLKAAGPTFLGAKTNGLIEADFYGNNAGSNEVGNLRMRHAYGSMDWATTQVLFGQFWDIFGPGSADTIDFLQSGASGTPNSPRVPQIRLTQKFNLNADNGFKVVLGVQNPVQDAGSDSATGTNASGSAFPKSFGSVPNVAGQLVFSSKMLGVSPGMMGLGMSPLQLGVFGQYGQAKIGNRDIEPYGYGVYALVPLLKSSDGKNRAMTLTLEAQAYKAAGLSVQLATAAALANTTAGQETAAKGFGYWGQLKFYPTQDLGLTAGYGSRHAEHYASYNAATGFEKYNNLAYVNATYDLNAAIRLATEFEQNITKKGTNAAPLAATYGQNNIFRVAAYYFF